MPNVQFGICGDLDFHSTPEELNPLPTLKKDEVGKMLLKLNREPLEKERLVVEHGDLKNEIEKLLRLGVIREEGKIHVNFTFLDAKDSRFIFKECEPFAEKLCQLFLERKDELFNVLNRYENSRIPKEKLAFMIVGCYLLDWGALELFRKSGLADNLKSQPGGNEYTLWGEEEVEQMLKRIYWGGHAFKTGEYMFHTFGDHHNYTQRNALPDLFHIFSDFDFDGGEEYKHLLFDKRKELGVELGDIMNKIYMGERLEHDKNIQFLKKIGYVFEEKDLVLNIPYFTENEVPIITEAVEPFIGELERWTENELPILEEKLESIRPIQNGVPFEEVFVQLWHVVFGLTNKYLTENGMLYDTYEEGKGYLPGLFKGDVLKLVLKRFSSH
ncbi:MAG: hypothetical protein ACOCTK_00845 [Candidatus Saliniplasma sp.]